MHKKTKAIKKHPWLYELREDYVWNASKFINEDLYFESEWLMIDCGYITVSKKIMRGMAARTSGRY